MRKRRECRRLHEGQAVELLAPGGMGCEGDEDPVRKPHSPGTSEVYFTDMSLGRLL